MYNHHRSSAAIVCLVLSAILQFCCTNSREKTLIGVPRDRVTTVAFSPDSKRLASGSTDKTIKIWDVETGSLELSLEGHNESITAIAFSPDGTMLASGCGMVYTSGNLDGTIKLWDSHTGELKYSVNAVDTIYSSVLNFVFSHDKRTLISIVRCYHGRPGGQDYEEVKLWDPQTGEQKGRLKDLFHCTSFALSSDGKSFATSDYWNKTISIWDIQTGVLKKSIKDTENPSLLAFSFDVKLIASISNDRTVKLWDTQTGRLMLTLPSHHQKVVSIGFSPDGKEFASCGGDGELKLWATQTWQPKPIVRADENETPACISSDWKIILHLDSDHNLTLRDAETGELKGKTKAENEGSPNIQLSPDSSILANWQNDNIVRFTRLH